MALPRIVIDDVRPSTPTGAYPAKAATGETVPVSADIFKDGHDILAARVRWKASGSRGWSSSPLIQVGVSDPDRWTGNLQITEGMGRHEFVIDAWVNAYATWRHKLQAKLAAGVDVDVELQEGRLIFDQRAEETGPEHKAQLRSIAKQLANPDLDASARTMTAVSDEVAVLFEAPSKTDHITSTTPGRLWVDRERAVNGAWYELFPRSYGGFKGTAEQLDYVAGMGFDVVYLPPIHPIGNAYRKGRNNTLDPAPDDVGSPWAIGNADGGHLDVHPDLGTIDDFDHLVARANELGMEIALDYALNCSPDHPWAKEHPEWFTRRPDGSIAYAENPPKKYQDIYPINFWPDTDEDRVALWNACKEVLDYWIGHRVKIFRVDNPHTKPIAFWSWLIPAIQADHPDVLFLAEAFTRPKVMAKLAEVGFTQSYTYFTWRRNKYELTEYGVEVTNSRKADYMRPSFWPNTPDILAEPLRDAPLSAFRQRLVLAATLVPNYGIYSGYELGENSPMSPANEEYLESEKYELKYRDFGADWSLAPWIAHVNDIRRRHRAFSELRNLYFHGTDNDQIICYSKQHSSNTDTVLVVVNIDPYSAQECTLDLNLSEIDIGWDESYEAFDELTGNSFYWWGPRNYVRLEPDQAAHICHLRTNR